MRGEKMLRVISVIGTGEGYGELNKFAFELGRSLAEKGFVVLTGGLGGIMEEVSRGAKSARGITVGVLPTYRKEDANPFVDIAIPTGLGHARNIIVASSGDIVIAIGGGYGTLSEIGVALKLGKRVLGYKTWEIEGVIKVESVEEIMKYLMNPRNF